MYLCLPGLCASISSLDAAVTQRLSSAFGLWAHSGHAGCGGTAGSVSLELAAVEQVGAPANWTPHFRDDRTDSPGLEVSQTSPSQLRLHFPGAAQAEVSLGQGNSVEAATVTLAVARTVLFAGNQLEDIIYTCLAPVLRRHGLFLIHAFAAARPGRAVLISGPSGSGKTTAGLALLLDGWSYLANDILLLQKRAEGVCAVSTPGYIHVRQESLALLPGLANWDHGPPSPLAGPGRGPASIAPPLKRPSHDVEAVPVGTIFFPVIADSPDSHFEPMGRAECLARLMSESVDRWDRPMLAAQLNVLEALAQQCVAYRLHLGRDVAQLPSLLPSN